MPLETQPELDSRTIERLDRSAPLARSLAESLCRTPLGRDHCGALHGVWPTLRRLAVAAEPARHAAFYGEALGAYAESGRSTRVLVSGCADWGMLALAAAAYAARGAALDVTVVDRCPTPVLLCAWYGAEIGVPVRTAVADVARYVDAPPYDLICTHSLLTYAALEGRRALVANWRRLLRPGGAVVTVSRLGAQAMTDDDLDERARRFGHLVADRSRSAGDADDLRARAERFAKAQISHPVGDAAALRGLFETNGFDVVRLDVRVIEGALARAPIVGTARTGEYAEIVAVRR